jgi:chromosome segregation ATPase
VFYVGCGHVCDGGEAEAFANCCALQPWYAPVLAVGVGGAALLTGMWTYTSALEKANDACLSSLWDVNASLGVCREGQERAERRLDSLMKSGTELSRCQDLLQNSTNEVRRYSDKLIEYYDHVQKTTEANHRLVLANQTNTAEIERLKKDAAVLEKMGEELQGKNVFLAGKSNRQKGEIAEAKAFNRELREKIGEEKNKAAVCEKEKSQCKSELDQRGEEIDRCREKEKKAQEVLAAYRKLRAKVKQENGKIRLRREIIPDDLMPNY